MDHASVVRRVHEASRPRAGDRPADVDPERWRPRLPAGLALARHQLRRVWYEPIRLRRLHYASAFASLRSLIEPDERRFVCEYFGIDGTACRRLEADLCADTDFLREVEARHRARRGVPVRLLGTTAAEDHDRCLRLLYYAVRLERPEVVVETGVFDGFSSAVILKALRDNGRGRLCSVDLPARTPQRASTDRMVFGVLPSDADPGWIVPESLRAGWELRLGTSRDVLPPWLTELGTIDVFFHDSLHTFAAMSWEYAQAWHALAPGGLLLSDDVFWNTAFWRFRRATGGVGRVVRGMGFLRKPRAGEGVAQ